MAWAAAADACISCAARAFAASRPGARRARRVARVANSLIVLVCTNGALGKALTLVKMSMWAIRPTARAARFPRSVGRRAHKSIP